MKFLLTCDIPSAGVLLFTYIGHILFPTFQSEIRGAIDQSVVKIIVFWDVTQYSVSIADL
jgi:hypothetical protein